jgi:hypothetical protein
MPSYLIVVLLHSISPTTALTPLSVNNSVTMAGGPPRSPPPIDLTLGDQVPVAVIAFGHKYPEHMSALDEKFGDTLPRLDLRREDLLKHNPGDKTSRPYQRLNNEWTLQSVIEQPGFTKACQISLQRLFRGIFTLLVGCNGCNHRAPTFAAVLMAVINGIMKLNPTTGMWEPMYNCQLFDLGSVPFSRLSATLDSAQMWLLQPWDTNPGCPSLWQPTMMWGYLTVRQNQMANDNYKRVIAGTVKMFGMPVSDPSTSRPEVPNRVREIMACVNPPPAYATIAHDKNIIFAWWDVLEAYSLDEAARHDLFALSQLDEWGYLEANNLIYKLIKDSTYHVATIRKPSAYIHNCCAKFRREWGYETDSGYTSGRKRKRSWDNDNWDSGNWDSGSYHNKNNNDQSWVADDDEPIDDHW